jgi:hypothetical protein
MKAVIKTVKYLKEYETKFGPLHSFEVTYNDSKAYYSSRTKDQTNFVEGKEAEFVEETKLNKNNVPYITIKPAKPAFTGQNNYAKAVKKEQSKYSGFAVSYVKDMIIAGKIELKDWEAASEKIFNCMVKLDKTLD